MEEEKIFDFLKPSRLYKDKYHLPMMTTIEFIDEFQEMEVRHDDVFIVTYPKSGTHWMQELVHLIFADGDVTKITASQRMLVAEMVDVPKLEMVPDGQPNFRMQKDLPSPRVFTTHVQCAMLPKEIWREKCRVIYVYRQPKDVFCSYYNFDRKMNKIWTGVQVPDTAEHFDKYFHTTLRGENGYGNWFDHVLEYYPHRDKEFFLFISFEEMKKDIALVIERVGAFLGRNIDGATLQRISRELSLEAMKKAFGEDHQKQLAEKKEKVDPNVFLNKGSTGQWKTLFTEAQNAEFDNIFRRRMKGCDLTRDYMTEPLHTPTGAEAK